MGKARGGNNECESRKENQKLGSRRYIRIVFMQKKLKKLGGEVLRKCRLCGEGRDTEEHLQKKFRT